MQGYEFAAFDFGTTFADGGELGLSWRVDPKAATFKILAPGLAQELRTGTIFLLLDSCHLLGHGWGQRDSKGVCGSHGFDSLVLLVVT